ncbi:MAG: heparan-alpha-glucosaminide N-acetyltransferase [Methanosarcinaceae archaeon]
MYRAKGRFWEIDFLRGLAVVLMLGYHFLYDLDFFRLAEFELNSGLLSYIGRGAAEMFILVSGAALSISYSRANGAGASSPTSASHSSSTLASFSAISSSSALTTSAFPSKLFRKYLRRGLKLFTLGLVLTAVTRVFLPERYILFGILHFFGVSAILAYPYLRLKEANLLMALLFFIPGYWLGTRTFGFSTLIWLGFRPEHFQALDYFPVFPWFGMVLLGIYLGNSLYAGGIRQFAVPAFEGSGAVKGFAWLGKHSLFIYFIHQPLFLALLWTAGYLDLNLI